MASPVPRTWPGTSRRSLPGCGIRQPAGQGWDYPTSGHAEPGVELPTRVGGIPLWSQLGDFRHRCLATTSHRAAGSTAATTDRHSRLKLTVRDYVRDGRQSSRGSAARREEPPGRSKYPPICAATGVRWSHPWCVQNRPIGRCAHPIANAHSCPMTARFRVGERARDKSAWPDGSRLARTIGGRSSHHAQGPR